MTMPDQNSKFRILTRRFRGWIENKLPYLLVIMLIFLLVIIYLWPRIFIIIPPGNAGVLYRPFGGGTETVRIYPERLHIINPFNTMYIYEVRERTIRYEFVALSKRGLPIDLAIAIRFLPIYEMLGLLHKDIGPDYVNRIVLPQVESVIRKKVGQRTAEEIYTNESGALVNIVNLAIEEVGRDYVQIDDIIIRTVELPKAIKNAIDDKLVQEQLEKSYVHRIRTARSEAIRKRIEARGIRDYQSIISQTLNDQLIRWQGVKATESIAESENAKIVVIGAGEEGLPVILGK